LTLSLLGSRCIDLTSAGNTSAVSGTISDAFSSLETLKKNNPTLYRHFEVNLIDPGPPLLPGMGPYRLCR
jgi:hypothetical protein